LVCQPLNPFYFWTVVRYGLSSRGLNNLSRLISRYGNCHAMQISVATALPTHPKEEALGEM